MSTSEYKDLIRVVATIFLFLTLFIVGITNIKHSQNDVIETAIEMYETKLRWYSYAEIIYNESEKNTDINIQEYLSSINNSRIFFKKQINSLKQGYTEVVQPFYAVEGYNLHWVLESSSDNLKIKKDIKHVLLNMEELEEQLILQITIYNDIAKKYNKRIKWSILNIFLQRRPYPLLNPDLNE